MFLSAKIQNNLQTDEKKEPFSIYNPQHPHYLEI